MITVAQRRGRLLLSGPDASGIVASFTHLLFSRGCGIVDCTSESSQNDERAGDDKRRMFFQRIKFDYSNVSVDRNVIEDEINNLCREFGMESQLVNKSSPSHL
jgi:formyltetrahydrofolate hydrolase